MPNAATTGAARRNALLLALILASTNAPADSITYSNLVAGELLTSAHSALYAGYRQGDPGVTNNWYRWVVKVEKPGPNPGKYNFKFDVPEDFAGDWNNKGNGGSGLLILNQASVEKTGDWNGSGSTNSVNGAGFTRVYRIFDGGPLATASQLTSSNPFTLEYLCRVGSNNLVTVVRTNGFYVGPIGGDGVLDWDGYVTNTLDTPVPYSALPDCTIQAVASGPGAVSPTNVTVKLGESAGFEIAAQTGCSVTDIRTNGVSIGGPFGMTSTNYVWPNIRASGTLEAVFAFTDSGGGTDQVVNVWENDGRPGIGGTSLTWTFVVRNNSGLLPAGSPYNEHVTTVWLKHLYSSGEPQDGGIPTYWQLQSTETAPNLWNVTLYCNDSDGHIAPGILRTFPILTTIPTTNHVVRIGTLYGQGYMPANLWQPQPTPGDPFLGPVGVDAPSYTITVQQPTNGTVSPMSAVVEYGTSTNFLITADAGYVISDIRTNGTSVGAIPDGLTNTNFIWRDIRKDGSLAATFARPDPSMEIEVDIAPTHIIYTVSNTSTNGESANNLMVLVIPAGRNQGVYEAAVEPIPFDCVIHSNDTTFVGADGSCIPPGFYSSFKLLATYTNLTKRSATAESWLNGPFNPVLVDVPVAPSFTLEVRSEYGTPDPGTLTNVVYGSVVTQRIERVVGDGPGKRYRVTGAEVR